jgi:hypothetical protein
VVRFQSRMPLPCAANGLDPAERIAAVRIRMRTAGVSPDEWRSNCYHDDC